MDGAIVGLDTATADVAVAVVRNGDCLWQTALPAERGAYPRHATALLGEVERAAAEAGGWDEVTLIAAGLGPGSYTGLRIGIATAQGLAQALAKPLAGVSSLAALGEGIGSLRAAQERSRLAVIDARRSQVFAALYGPDGKELWEPLVAVPTALAERIGTLPAPPLAAGDGSVRFRRELENAGAEVLPDDDPAHRIAARHICALARDARPAGPGEIRPIYLRPPDAERWLERDKG